MFRYALFLAFCLPLAALGQSDPLPHPRALVRAEQVPQLRQKVQQQPYAHYLELLKQGYEDLKAEGRWQPKAEANPYDVATLAMTAAQVYLLTGDQHWAEESQFFTDRVISDSVFFQDPTSKGLTRCHQLTRVMTAYDLCYDAWDEDFRHQFSRATFPVMMAISAHMGRGGNYGIASNWMGVRYATVLYSTLIWDGVDNSPEYRKRHLNPLQWASTNRLKDFMKANVHPDGWNVESLGYYLYGFSFVLPALVSVDNYYPDWEGLGFEEVVQNAQDAWMTATVPIPTPGGVGVKPDFSDDGPNSTSWILPYSFPLLSEDTWPRYKWANGVLNNDKSFSRPEAGAFKTIIYEPAVETRPPADEFLQFVDPTHGFLMLRDRFQDENDILFAANATQVRRGHQGSDNLSFRLIGLGSVWTVGAGRTNLVAGQTALLPETPTLDTRYVSGSLGVLESYDFAPDRLSATMSGSCTGVEDHRRTFHVTYDSSLLEAPAVVVVKDQSANGAVWRLATPEYNELKVLKDGFLLTAPNGSTMRATVLGLKKPKVSSDLVPYGGKTVQHNTGIAYRDKVYSYTRVVDVACDGDITVVLTLAPEGAKHPKVTDDLLGKL